MRTADWYFDFISPYSHLALYQLQDLPGALDIRYRPVLFAGLLSHWDNKGPAEIAPKRRWTYRWCTWHAQRAGIPFRMPTAHPFNPLPYLRLCLAAGSSATVVKTIFDALWTTGADPADPRILEELMETLGVPESRLLAPEVKQALRGGTEQAARNGIFGVPSLQLGENVFWGTDGLEFARAYLDDPTIIDNAEMRRIDGLPIAASRRPG